MPNYKEITDILLFLNPLRRGQTVEVEQSTNRSSKSCDFFFAAFMFLMLFGFNNLTGVIKPSGFIAVSNGGGSKASQVNRINSLEHMQNKKFCIQFDKCYKNVHIFPFSAAVIFLS